MGAVVRLGYKENTSSFPWRDGGNQQSRRDSERTHSQAKCELLALIQGLGYTGRQCILYVLCLYFPL